MVPHHGKKLSGRHLKGNRNILISVYHDHIVFLLVYIQIGPPVISNHLHRFRQSKIFSGQVCDLLVDLHPFHLCMGKIAAALGGKCPRPHT